MGTVPSSTEWASLHKSERFLDTLLRQDRATWHEQRNNNKDKRLFQKGKGFFLRGRLGRAQGKVKRKDGVKERFTTELRRTQRKEEDDDSVLPSGKKTSDPNAIASSAKQSAVDCASKAAYPLCHEAAGTTAIPTNPQSILCNPPFMVRFEQALYSLQ
jgi:phage terminase large subunit GpA-like protein